MRGRSWIAGGLAAALAASVAFIGPAGPATAALMTELTYVNIGGGPMAAAVSPDGATAVVANQDPNGARLDFINAGNNAVIGSASLSGSTPTSVAVSADGAYAYVAMSLSNTIEVVDMNTRTVTGFVPTGAYPVSVVVNPILSRLIVANTNDNTISLFDITNSATPVNPVTVPVGIQPLYSATALTTALVPNYGDGTISVIDLSLNQVVRTINLPLNSAPRQVAITPDGTRGYATDGFRSKVLAFNTDGSGSIDEITFTSPLGIAMGMDGKAIFVTSTSADSVSTINTATLTITQTISLQFPTSPMYPGINPNGTRLYVPNFDVGSVGVISTGLRSVTFNANGGSGSQLPQSNYFAAPLASNAFTNAGFTFAGWSTSAGVAPVVYADGANYTFADDTTLYAQWTAAVSSHTVTFDANGGTGTMAPQTASAPTALTANAFTRTGYAFTGWNTAQGGGGTPYANQATYPFTADDTLYAQWALIPRPRNDPPSAPLSVTASAGDASVDLAWAAPQSSGSYPISTYEATVSPGGRSCVVTAPALACTIDGLSNGTTYTATVRARNDAGWGPSSTASALFTPAAPPRPTITITGTRGDVQGRPGIIVAGTTTEMGMGALLKPWFRFPGQASFTEGAGQILVDRDGGFTWQRRTQKRISVYVATVDGSVTSNRVVVGAS